MNVKRLVQVRTPNISTNTVTCLVAIDLFMTSAWLTRSSCASYNYTLAELEKAWILTHRHSQQKRQRSTTFATQLDSRYRYIVCLLVKNIFVYLKNKTHVYAYACVYTCVYINLVCKTIL